MTTLSPSTIKRRVTVRRKNELHDIYRTNCERILRRRLGPEDVTPAYYARREAFVKVMLPLYEAEKRMV